MAAGESSLLDMMDPDRRVIRFLWLRAFHHPIIVRVEIRKNDARLRAKELSGSGTSIDPFRQVTSRDRSLTKEEAHTLNRLFEPAPFWTLENRHPDMKDGARWVTEMVEATRYHVVNQLSPDDGPYFEACLYLLKLSGLPIEPIY